MIKATTLFLGLITIAACAQQPTTGSLRDLHDKARFEYKLECIDELVERRNQPLHFASRVCSALSWQQYPVHSPGA